MLLLLIVVTLGVLLTINLAYIYSLNQQKTMESMIRRELESRQDLSILLVSGRSQDGTVSVVLASGNWPVKVLAIYVNGSLAINYEPPLELDALDVQTVTFESPTTLSPNTIVRVRVVYEGGTVESFGYVA